MITDFQCEAINYGIESDKRFLGAVIRVAVCMNLNNRNVTIRDSYRHPHTERKVYDHQMIPSTMKKLLLSI